MLPVAKRDRVVSCAGVCAWQRGAGDALTPCAPAAADMRPRALPAAPAARLLLLALVFAGQSAVCEGLGRGRVAADPTHASH